MWYSRDGGPDLGPRSRVKHPLRRASWWKLREDPGASAVDPGKPTGNQQDMDPSSGLSQLAARLEDLSRPL